MTAGTVQVEGRDHRPHSPRRSLRSGIVLTPEDRKAEGLVLPFSIRNNVRMSTLSKLARFGIVSGRAVAKLAELSIRRPAHPHHFGGPGGPAPVGRQPAEGGAGPRPFGDAARLHARRADPWR